MNEFDEKIELDIYNHHGLRWEVFSKVKVNNKWGIICEITLDCYNYHPDVVVEPEYDEIEKVGQFFYLIRKEGKYGLVNGPNVILKPNYGRIYAIPVGEYRYRVEVKDDPRIGMMNEGYFSWLNTQCKPQELIEYDIIRQIQNETNVQLECIKKIDDSSIPGYIINQTGNIIELNLGHQHMYQFPVTVIRLVHLCHLNLKANKIVKLPGSICELKNLQVLNMSRNNLEDLPASIGKLYNLKELYLQYNNIYKIPASLAKLEQLILLNITSNKVKEIPGNIKKRKNLRVIM